MEQRNQARKGRQWAKANGPFETDPGPRAGKRSEKRIRCRGRHALLIFTEGYSGVRREHRNGARSMARRLIRLDGLLAFKKLFPAETEIMGCSAQAVANAVRRGTAPLRHNLGRSCGLDDQEPYAVWNGKMIRRRAWSVESTRRLRHRRHRRLFRIQAGPFAGSCRARAAKPEHTDWAQDRNLLYGSSWKFLQQSPVILQLPNRFGGRSRKVRGNRERPRWR